MRPALEYPYFLFYRRHDIELEAGLALAGKLFIDVPGLKRGRRKQPKKAMRVVNETIQQLAKMAVSGNMPLDAEVYGWNNPLGDPANRVDVDDAALMTAWVDKHCIVIAVRVGRNPDDKFRPDSEILQQLGMVSREPDKVQ